MMHLDPTAHLHTFPSPLLWERAEECESPNCCARVGHIDEWHADLRKPQGEKDIGKMGLSGEDGAWQPFRHRQGGPQDAVFSPRIVPRTGELSTTSVPSGWRFAVHQCPHGRVYGASADRHQRLVGPDL